MFFEKSYMLQLWLLSFLNEIFIQLKYHIILPSVSFIKVKFTIQFNEPFNCLEYNIISHMNCVLQNKSNLLK